MTARGSQPPAPPRRGRRGVVIPDLPPAHRSAPRVIPVYASHRVIAICTYVGSTSSPTHRRPVFWAAIIAVPLPMNGSNTTSPGAELFSSARSTNATGFWVLWPVVGSWASCPPLNGFKFGTDQTVACVRSPHQREDLPARTAYQHGSCCQW